MNATEFESWLADYERKFPSVRKWLSNLGESRNDTVHLWFEVLGTTALADAMEVSRLMAHGEIDPIGSYDSERERTGVFVKRAAHQLTLRRSPKEPQTPYRPAEFQQRAKSVRPIRQAITRLERMVASGHCAADAARQLYPDDHDRRDYRKCPLCSNGFVAIWSQYTISAVRADRDVIEVRTTRRTCQAPCKCELGQAKIWETENGQKPVPKQWCGWISINSTFHESRDCIVVGGNKHGELAINALLEWLDRSPNRVAEFDAWNEGAAV